MQTDVEGRHEARFAPSQIASHTREFQRLRAQIHTEQSPESVRFRDQRNQILSNLPSGATPPSIGPFGLAQSSAASSTSTGSVSLIGTSVQPSDVGQTQFTSIVAEKSTALGKELGIVFPPGSQNVFSVDGSVGKLLSLGQSVTVELDKADKPYVRIPAAAEMSGLEHVVPLVPALQAQRALRTWMQSHPDRQAQTRGKTQTSGQPSWTPESFGKEAAKHEWCRDLDDAQSGALMEFMNRARVWSFDEVGSALQSALFGGSQRPPFEAACAVYASGVGEIDEQDDEGNTCLHTMVRVHDPDAARSAWANME
ncbi:MAG TPA: hypothetical protein VF169_25025 [Albitalea sp.]|uniref:hypothetical protein n=1 Tax=Piscinibacter sp. TaxID=1903157 RepID=UPI002ED0161E